MPCVLMALPNRAFVRLFPLAEAGSAFTCECHRIVIAQHYQPAAGTLCMGPGIKHNRETQDDYG